MIAAGLVTKNGKAKYTGVHALHHFYASTQRRQSWLPS
jgi:hypothetical protein